MKAQEILRTNIADLLMIRREDQSVLARWCGHNRSWINKIVNGHRPPRVEDLDQIADFFGIATYQLFQPGISPISERRETPDRRKGGDRRIGHRQRELQSMARDVSYARDPKAPARRQPITRNK